MDRFLHGTLEIRAVDDEQRIIEGVASTNAVDDYDTILEPKGARFTLPMPLLWQHQSESPVGHVLEAKVTANRITIRAKIAKIAEAGPLKDELDRIWQLMKYGLVPGLSVGFKPVKTAGGTSAADPLRFVEWIWRELSLVTLPANIEATITAVRSADLALLATSGNGTPGRSGSGPSDTGRKMTIAEQITQHSNTRAFKVARQQALMDASEARGETLAANEAEEYDTLTAEVEAIDSHLTRLSSLQRANAAAAVPVVGVATVARASENRGGVPVVRTRANTAPGIGFAREAMVLLECRGNRYEAAQRARERWGDAGEEVALHLRAPVAAGTTQNATFAAPLVATTFLDEFLELLRPATIIGRIPGLRHVPFNISMPSQTAGGTYKWVGEGKPKPITNLQLAAVTLGMAKASGIIVLTEELVRSSSPSAEEVVKNELRDGITQFLDGQFTDPAIAAVANVNPASITNGVAGTVAGGTTEAFARSDLRALIGSFTTNNLGAAGLVLLMNESVAFTLSTLVNAVGEQSFPGLTAVGGTLMGIPVVTSNTITAATGIIALHAPSILMADEGGIEIDVSREASLQMDSAPTDPPVDATVMVSLWQMNLVGLRVERFINWGKARANAVNRIHTVAYV